MTDIRAKPQIPQHFHPDFARSISIDVESTSSGSGGNSPTAVAHERNVANTTTTSTSSARRNSFSPNWNLYKVGSETRVAIRKISAPLVFQYGSGGKPPSPLPGPQQQRSGAYRSAPSPSGLNVSCNGEPQ